jgi:hypothetical protein
MPPFDLDCADHRGFAGDPDYQPPRPKRQSSPGAYAVRLVGAERPEALDTINANQDRRRIQ